MATETEWKNLVIYKGTTKTYTLYLYKDSQPADITGWSIYFTVKENLLDTDANAKINKTITSHEDALNGETEIVLSKTDTDLTVGEYYYDISYLDDDSNEAVLYQGRLTIAQPVRTTRS